MGGAGPVWWFGYSDTQPTFRNNMCVGWAEFSLPLLHMKWYLNGSLVKTYKSSMLIFLEQ